MAIEEINAKGGVLGKKIEAIVEDPESKFTDVFPEKAKKLLLKDKVPVVFGCWTSVSRKNVLPVFEENNGLLFYPVQYEGNESSKNVVYTGAAPNQQILPAVEWLMSKAGGEKKKFYLLGSDYIFPRTANLIIVKYLESKGLKPVAEKYTPLGHLEYQNIVQDIKKEDPDVIFSTINGDSNVNFYNELAAQGITADKCPVVAVSVGEDELRGLDPAKVKGHLAAWNYFQSIDTPVNKEFVKRFKAKYGAGSRHRRPDRGGLLRGLLLEAGRRKGRLHRRGQGARGHRAWQRRGHRVRRPRGQGQARPEDAAHLQVLPHGQDPRRQAVRHRLHDARLDRPRPLPADRLPGLARRLDQGRPDQGRGGAR